MPIDKLDKNVQQPYPFKSILHQTKLNITHFYFLATILAPKAIKQTDSILALHLEEVFII